MNQNRRPSEPDLELQEITGSKFQKSKDQSAPLLQHKPHDPKPHRPASVYSFFRRCFSGRDLMLYVCLGILLICLLVLILYFILAPDESNLNYKVTSTYIAPDKTLYSSTLEWQQSAKEQEGLSQTRKAVTSLNMSIQCYTSSHLHLTIGDSERLRWRVPEQDPYPHVANPAACDYSTSDVDFSVQQDPFSLKVWRKSTKETLLDTSDLAFIFSQNYIEFNTKIPSLNFYGLGERLYKFQMGTGTYTIFPTDRAGEIEAGQPGHNLYGQQPMYLIRENSGNYHIVLLRNSNAMEIQISQDQTMKFQVVGGILDFHIFLGSKDPESLVETYHDYLGNWIVPPFWSMGYHQSKWGYANISEFTGVLQGYRDNNIPLDVIWSDIDYMLDYIAFTIDTTNYPVEDVKAVLAEYDKKWVPIIDVGIGNQPIPENIGYARGLEKDVFLKDKLGNVLIGKVWPGESVFPDFFHPNASGFWTEMLDAVYTQIPYDGIWLDMNEISSFCNGSCVNKTASVYDDLPFFPGNTNLDYKTISLDAVHYGGIQEFDVHSVFNILEQQVTYNYLKTKNPLPFILSRANIFGSGKYASHWFGDLNSDWISMRYTVASMFNYNLFGIPHVGADICGFLYATTPELCTRWTQLGAFYPFARNHHEKLSSRQEPFQFEDPYKSAMIAAIRFRYSIIKQFYTLFLSKKGRGTIIRPLFFEFPDDLTLFGNGGQNAYVEQQFMIGKSLMVAPILYEKATQTQVYFPAGSWFSLLTYEQVQGLDVSRNQTIDSPLDSMIPTYLRGGWIYMVQDSSTVMSTKDLTNEFSMIVALDGDLGVGKTSVSLKASGEILDVEGYTEDIISSKCIGKDCVLLLSVELVWNSETSKVTINVNADRRTASDPPEVNSGNVVVKEIRVLGSVIKKIDVDEIGEVSLVDGNNVEGGSKTVQVNEDGESLVLSVEDGIALGNGSRYTIGN